MNTIQVDADSVAGENLQPIDLMSPPSHAEDEEEAEPVYSEVAPEELLPPPDFKPFFTLVENPETGEHHHPSVHYVFYDDDQDILTDATLHAIDQGANSGEEAGGEERIVLLDMAPDGKTVESATSLSPKWQALKATVGQAPSWGDSSDSANKGLMLKISGQEVSDAVPQRHVKAKASSMDELVRSFGERLQGLDAVIGTEAAEDAA